MKMLWALIKGILKIVCVLVGITLLFCAIFLTMIYFSSSDQYTQIVEKGFVQATGQKIKIKGGVEFRPKKTLNTTFNDSTLKIESKIGTITISAARLYMSLPWNVLFTQDITLEDVEGHDISLTVTKNNKTEKQFTVQAFTTDIIKDCCEIKFDDITLIAKEGIAKGAIQIDIDEPVLVATGTMMSKKWTLDKDLDVTTKTYSFDGVQNFEGKIKFHVDVLVLPKRELKNVEAVLDLKSKDLKVISSDK